MLTNDPMLHMSVEENIHHGKHSDDFNSPRTSPRFLSAAERGHSYTSGVVRWGKSDEMFTAVMAALAELEIDAKIRKHVTRLDTVASLVFLSPFSFLQK